MIAAGGPANCCICSNIYTRDTDRRELRRGSGLVSIAPQIERLAWLTANRAIATAWSASPASHLSAVIAADIAPRARAVRMAGTGRE